jgi:hypothetical protein
LTALAFVPSVGKNRTLLLQQAARAIWDRCH